MYFPETMGSFFSSQQAVAQTSSAVQCDFSRDLEIGSIGEDVRCIQQFLNSQGFTISQTGPGSSGNETTLFGGLTKDAIARWQEAMGISPASGMFGPLSRAKFLEKLAATLSSQVASLGSTPSTSGLPLVFPSTPTPTPVASESQAEKQARSAVKEALNLIEEAEDLADDAETVEEEEDALDEIEDAKDDLIKALKGFSNKDFDEMRSRAEDAVETLEDLIKDLGGDEDDAQDALDDAEEAIEDAKNEIDDADDDDEDVDEAEEILEEAEDTLDDAQEAFDDGDFDDAIELAQEAAELADEAVGAIGN